MWDLDWLIWDYREVYGPYLVKEALVRMKKRPKSIKIEVDMENTEHIIYLNNSKNIEALYERLKSTKIHKKLKFRSFKFVKMCRFYTSRISEIDFT